MAPRQRHIRIAAPLERELERELEQVFERVLERVLEQVPDSRATSPRLTMPGPATSYSKRVTAACRLGQALAGATR